jgi:general secretion pathway protein D
MIASQNALVLRGTSDQLVLAEKLLADIDKPKAEVVIDIAVMQVSRDRVRTLGTSPPTSANVVMVPNGSNSTGSGNSGNSSGSGTNGAFNLNTLKSLNATNFLVTIPGASFSFLMSDSNTKLLQNPEIRALDNEKATLKIGDRVPVATGSFQPGMGGVGISPLVSTQFQYLDVGVNIDITPHIHSGNEVTLKMVLEISSVTGSQNIGGLSQPIIGQRRIEHETRLQDGDINLVGGILEDSEVQSLSGYPWVSKVPILKYLFAQEEKQRRENEIVFAITPHIVRAQDVTEQNLRVVDVGTGNAIGVRRKDTKANKAGNAPKTPSATPQAVPPASQSTQPTAEPRAPRQPARPVASETVVQGAAAESEDYFYYGVTVDASGNTVMFKAHGPAVPDPAPPPRNPPVEFRTVAGRRGQ